MHVTDTPSVASRIELAFQSASSSTGTSFDYLVKTAARESSFNPSAKAKTSSAIVIVLFNTVESPFVNLTAVDGKSFDEWSPCHDLQFGQPL